MDAHVVEEMHFAMLRTTTNGSPFGTRHTPAAVSRTRRDLVDAGADAAHLGPIVGDELRAAATERAQLHAAAAVERVVAVDLRVGDGEPRAEPHDGGARGGQVGQRKLDLDVPRHRRAAAYAGIGSTVTGDAAQHPVAGQRIERELVSEQVAVDAGVRCGDGEPRVRLIVAPSRAEC